MTERPELPDGQESFKLNEVCKLANVQPYMLRFWGSEFPQLEAGKSSTGQRVYSREQVETILEIRRLLFDEGLTIAGARKRLGADVEAETGSVAVAAERPGVRRVPAPTPSEPVVAKTVVAPTPTVDLEAEVDKRVGERVQPLVAALQELRSEVAAMLEGIRSSSV